MDLKDFDKFYRGECDKEELKRVLLWFKGQNLNLDQQNELQKIWERLLLEEKSTNIDGEADELLKKIHNSIKLQKSNMVAISTAPSPKGYFWLKVAAVLMLTTLISVLVAYYSSGDRMEVVSSNMVLKENTKGIKTSFMLEDGTRVFLNSDSRVRYPERFSEGERVVFLEGEAYFNVAKNPLKPFRVISGDLITEALGTSFNVRDYLDEGRTQISLETGRVLVKKTDAGIQEVILNPGEEVDYTDEDKILQKRTFDDLKPVSAWKEGWIIFKNAKLPEITRTLERWYGVNITVLMENKDASDDWNYSGEFHNQTLENVLNGIGYVENLSFEINGKNVNLTIKN